MKTLTIMLSILMGMGLFSCNEIDTSFDPVSDDAQRIADEAQRISKIDYVLMNSTWRNIFSWSAGQATTNDFAGFKFSFLNTGKVMATNGFDSFDGRWSTSSEGNKIRLTMTFIGENGFENLSREWSLTFRDNASFSRIYLQDLFASKADSYFATFEAI